MRSRFFPLRRARVGTTVDVTPTPPPFVPSSLPGLSLWLDCSQPSSLVVDGSLAVSSWGDLSGSGKPAVQASGSLRPTYEPHGLPGLKPCVSFASQILRTAAPVVPWTSNLTLAYVGSAGLAVGSDTGAPVGQGWAAVWVGGVFAAILTDPSTGQYAVSAPAGSSLVYSSTLAQTHLASGLSSYRGTAPAGPQPIAADTLRASPAAGLGLGITSSDSSYAPGWLAEVLLWSRVLAPADLLSVQAYLAAKWGY